MPIPIPTDENIKINLVSDENMKSKQPRKYVKKDKKDNKS